MVDPSVANAAKHFDELIDAMEALGLRDFAAPGRRLATEIDASLNPAVSAALEAKPTIRPTSYLDFWQLPNDFGREEELQDSVVDYWQHLLLHVVSPRSRAKLADLIWCAKPNNSAAAATALETYLESSQASYASSAPNWSDWDPN